MINADAAPRNWQVPFAPGILRATAGNDGKTLATDELRTAGQPAQIILTTGTKALAPDWNEVATVRAVIADAAGVEIPRANDLISFAVSGPGTIAAVDNGDNSSHELFQTDSRHAYQGECVAYVKATVAGGDIQLTATAPGLAGGSILIHTAK
jgi:beta-galactosidase